MNRQNVESLDRNKKENFLWYMKNNPVYFRDAFGMEYSEGAALQAWKTFHIKHQKKGKSK